MCVLVYIICIHNIVFSKQNAKHWVAPVKATRHRHHHNPDLMWCCVRQQMFYCCYAILKWTRGPTRTENVYMYYVYIHTHKECVWVKF